MEKHKLLLTVLLVCACRAQGIFPPGDNDTRQVQDKLNSKELARNIHNVNSKELARNIHNGNLEQIGLRFHLLHETLANGHRPRFVSRDVNVWRKHAADNGKHVDRKSIVQFKSASGHGREMKAADSWQHRFSKYNQVKQTNNHVLTRKESQVIEKVRKTLQGISHLSIELQTAAQKVNTDDYINNYLKRLLQKKNQYAMYVHRVKKSVDGSHNRTLKSTQQSDVFSQQFTSGVSTKQTTSVLQKTLGLSNSPANKQSSVTSYKVSHSSIDSNINPTNIAGDSSIQTHAVHMVTISSYQAPSTTVSSVSTPDIRVDGVTSTQTTVHSYSQSDHSQESHNNVDTVTKSSNMYNTASYNVHMLSTTPASLDTIPNQVSAKQEQTTTISKLNSSEQLKQTQNENSLLGKLVSSTVKQPETPARTLASPTGLNTKSLLVSTEGSISPLSTSVSHTSGSSSSHQVSEVTTIKAAIVKDAIQNLTTAVNTPSTIEPLTFPISTSEPVPETNAELTTIMMHITEHSSPEPSTSRNTSPEPSSSSTSPEPSSSSTSPEPSSSSTSPEPSSSSTSPEPSSSSTSPEPSSSSTSPEPSSSSTSPEPSSLRNTSPEPSSSSTSPEPSSLRNTSPEPSSSGNTSPETSSSRSPEAHTSGVSEHMLITSSFVSSLSAESAETVSDDITKIDSTKHSPSPVTVISTNQINTATPTSEFSPSVTIPTSSGGSQTSSKSNVTNSSPSKPNERFLPTPEPSPENKFPDDHYPTAATPQGVAEPGPDWEDAKKKWNFAWQAHLYLFGGLFLLIAIFVIVSMIRLFQINRLLSRKYFLTLNLLVLYFCALRAFYLLFDGYNSSGSFPDVLQYFLYSSVFPCLTSAFGILLFSLLAATQMQLIPPRIQKMKFLIVIILVHFVLQITTDVVVGVSAGARIMLFVCQLLYIVWGLFLFCGYAYVFKSLYYSAVKRQKTFEYMTASNTYMDDSDSVRKKFTLSLAVKVCLAAAAFGLVTVVLEIYSIISVYGIMSDKKPDAWAWWIYHSALRLTECLMCVTMSYIASQPFRYEQKYTNYACSVLCAPCMEMFSCSQSSAGDSLGWGDFDTLHMHTAASRTTSRTNGLVNGKKKVCMSDITDIVPVVMQSSSAETSRPNSLLIIEDGYVRFQTDNDINKIVDSYTGGPRHEMLTFSTGDGIVNGAYVTLGEPFSLDRASSHGYTRKSSLASSEYFHPPSSLSLADSMDDEIDKAFRSMREHEVDVNSPSSAVRPGIQVGDSVQGNSIEAYLEQQAARPRPMLRRSHSALGDVSDEKRESWRQKLCRTRSDTSGCVKTRDLDSQKYFSLLDLERQREMEEGEREEDGFSARYSSDDMFMDNSLPADLKRDYAAAKLLLTNNSDSDEIEV